MRVATASWCRRRGTRPSTTSPLASTAVVAEHGPAAVASYTGTGGPLDPVRLRDGPGLLPGARLVDHVQRAERRLLGQVPRARAGRRRAAAVPARPADDRPAARHRHQHRGLPRPRADDAEPARPPARPARRAAAGWSSSIPRRSETAHHADLHLAAAPGTDPALLAFARPPRARRSAPIRRSSTRAPIPTASPACATSSRRTPPNGRPRSAACRSPTSRRWRRWSPRPRRIGIETGTGVSMGRSANLTEWLVWALAAVTGSLDRDGRLHVQPRLPAGHRGRPARRSRRPRPAPGEPARPARASSTARCRARRWPTRSSPARCAP